MERPALLTSASSRPKRDGLLHHPLDVVRPGDVGMDRQHVAAGGAHFSGRTLDRRGLQGGNDHLPAGGGELLGDHAAQAA